MEETWLTVKEVINTEKISEKTFYRRFKLGHYPNHKYIPSSSGGRGGRQLLVALSSLPPPAKENHKVIVTYGGITITFDNYSDKETLTRVLLTILGN